MAAVYLFYTHNYYRYINTKSSSLGANRHEVHNGFAFQNIFRNVQCKQQYENIVLGMENFNLNILLCNRRELI